MWVEECGGGLRIVPGESIFAICNHFAYLCGGYMNKFCNKISSFGWGVVALYWVLCGLYFAPIAAPYKLVYPLALLTVASLRSRNPMLTVALAFSALGDFFGATGVLILQIGAFAVTQICYLVVLGRQTARHPLKHIALAAAVPVALCVVALVAIVPAIEWGAIKVGAVLYALLLGSMTTLAALAEGWCVKIGALMFMLSDFMLAHLIFVSPDAALLKVSLALYFAGQLLLWLGLHSAKRRC